MAERARELGFITAEVDSLREVVDRLDAEVSGPLAGVLAAVVDCLAAGGTLLVAGNGGSAADAGHLAAEFVGRCTRERGPLRAIALPDATATVTAVGNDYGYGEVFARQVRALARPGDVVLLLSTSGRSPNVVDAARAGREVGATVVAFTGAGGSALADEADIAVRAPSSSTQRIQEVHQLWGHTLAAWVDQELG